MDCIYHKLKKLLIKKIKNNYYHFFLYFCSRIKCIKVLLFKKKSGDYIVLLNN